VKLPPDGRTINTEALADGDERVSGLVELGGLLNVLVGELSGCPSARDASALQVEGDGGSVDAVRPGEGLDRFACLVAIDEFCDFVHTETYLLLALGCRTRRTVVADGLRFNDFAPVGRLSRI